jgi:hypothetical protein
MTTETLNHGVRSGTVRVNGAEIYHEIREAAPRFSSSRRADGTPASIRTWRRSWPTGSRS